MKNNLAIEKPPDDYHPSNDGIDEHQESSDVKGEETHYQDGNEEPELGKHLEAEIASLKEIISQLATDTHEVNQNLDTVTNEITRLKLDDAVLQQLHQRNRELSEDFHERELLAPIFLSLIGMTDRIYQQIGEAKKKKEKYRSADNQSLMRSAHLVIEQRSADLLEIENTLANFGVERYLSTDNKFQPQIHKCIQRIETRNTTLVGQVERSVLPGYKRNERPICKERVTVFVKAKATENIGESK